MCSDFQSLVSACNLVNVYVAHFSGHRLSVSLVFGLARARTTFACYVTCCSPPE